MDLILLISLISLIAAFWLCSKLLELSFAVVVCFALGIALIRPNILGESYGQYGALYWTALGLYLWGLNKNHNSEDNSYARLSSPQMLIIFMASIYWIYFYFKTSSIINISSPYIALANIGTLLVVMYGVAQLNKYVKSSQIIYSYILLISFFSFSIIPRNFLFDCTPVSLLARPFIYEVCFGSGVYVNTRLTGFSAEPGIFATLILIGMALLTKYPLSKSRTINFIVFVNLFVGLLKTQSTAGIFLFFVFLALRLLALTKKSQLRIALSISIMGIFTLFLPNLIRLSKTLTANKATQNSRSITDRALELSLNDYISKWIEFPFGNNQEITFRKGFGINLLTESLALGPIVIFLMAIAIFGAYLLSNREFFIFEVALLVFLSCLFSQPAWFNPLWLALVFSFLNSNSPRRADFRGKLKE